MVPDPSPIASEAAARLLGRLVGELVMATFDAVWLDELPVVAAAAPDVLPGRLRRRAIHRACSERLEELRRRQEQG